MGKGTLARRGRHAGLPGAHTLSLAIGSPSGYTTQPLHTNAAGAFTLSLGASAVGAWTFTVTYAGDHLHALSGAGCSTFVPPPPPPPSHRTGPPPPSPAPTETTLELTCRKHGSEDPFTGKISPTLAEVPIAITYEYKSPAGPLEKLVDHLNTNAAGMFSDKPAGINVDQTGTATASWPGSSGYLGATSPSCKFEP